MSNETKKIVVRQASDLSGMSKAALYALPTAGLIGSFMPFNALALAGFVGCLGMTHLFLKAFAALTKAFNETEILYILLENSKLTGNGTNDDKIGLSKEETENATSPE